MTLEYKLEIIYSESANFVIFQEEILPSDEDDELPKREISTAERALLEEEAAKLKYEKEQEEREEDERLQREYVELCETSKLQSKTK